MRERRTRPGLGLSVAEVVLATLVVAVLFAFLVQPHIQPRLGLALAVIAATFGIALGLPLLILRLIARLAALYPLLLLLGMHLFWWIPKSLLGSDAERLPPALMPRNLPVYGSLVRAIERLLTYDVYVWMAVLGVGLAVTVRMPGQADPRERRRLRWSLLGLVMAWGLAVGYVWLDPFRLFQSGRPR
jgi:hypothetical protein